jgi:adenine-specific DNA-methyltransferase
MKLERVARFRSHRVFRNAAIVPCITVLRKETNSGSPLKLLECQAPDREALTVRVLSSESRPQPRQGSSPWFLIQRREQQLAERISANHPVLETQVSRISAGPATGRDGLFVQPSEAFAGLEAELIHPAVRGRDLDRFAIATTGLRILVPYENTASGELRLVDLEDFPAVRRYLEQHRAQLEARHCVRVWEKPWFGFHDQPQPDLVRSRKILVPDVAAGNRFCLDDGRYFPLHSVYFLLPKEAVDPLYLTAVLNSKPIEFLIRLRAPTVKDGFSRYRRQFLTQLPVPAASSCHREELVHAAGISQKELDRVASEIFDLAAEDRRALDRFLLERQIP